MARVSTHVELKGSAEEAFTFYKAVFQSNFEGEIMRWGEMPKQGNFPLVPEEAKDLVMHVTLPILDGYLLMGSDALDLREPFLKMGNNAYINLNPDTLSETERLFNELSADGEVMMELEKMFWGEYFGSCIDQFGVCWMFNFNSSE